MLYFAYGSNLSLRHMKRHAPRAVPVGKARLEGYKLVFRRFIDVMPDKTGVVWGAAYEITSACERALDAYEDCPALYRKITVQIDVEGSTQAALAYVMNQTDIAPPAIAYYTILAQGYRDWKLDPAPLAKARIAVLHPQKVAKPPLNNGAPSP
jgi:gamma-glutamylcyclotransferase (GGCT)/AIG2-like uncharacterized protein YtfP